MTSGFHTWVSAALAKTPSNALDPVGQPTHFAAEKLCAEQTMRSHYKGLVTGAAVISTVVVGFATFSQARPLTPAENRYIPYSAALPECGDEGVLSTITSKFEQRESYYWKSGLEIGGFQQVRETSFRKTGVDYIPRRYCQAKAVVNDHKTRVVYYAIVEDMNMNGTDAIRSLSQSLTFGLMPALNLSPFKYYGVEWCVVGLDRNYAYGLNCKAARP